MSLPQLAAALLSALTELHGALDKLQHFEGVLVALESGEDPPALEGGWNELAARYDALAAAITDAPLPTDFDPTPYQTSFGEILDEQTRDQALAKLRGYLEQLRQADERGRDEARRLDDAEQETDTTSQALRALIDISSRLAQEFGGHPIFGEIVMYQWFDLEVRVRPALARVRSALQRQGLSLRRALERLDVSIGNLGVNIQTLEEWSRFKTVEGSWSSMDAAGRFALELSGASGTWTERREATALSRSVTVTDEGAWFKVTRVNDAAVLDFLGFRPSVRDEVLQKGPQPSFLLFRRDGNEIIAQWYGLKAILTASNHVDHIVQPGTGVNGVFRLRRV